MSISRRSLKQRRKDTKEALAGALQGLEDVRMTPSDDPKLAALKKDIRGTVEQAEPENE